MKGSGLIGARRRQAVRDSAVSARACEKVCEKSEYGTAKASRRSVQGVNPDVLWLFCWRVLDYVAGRKWSHQFPGGAAFMTV